ncbi:MAG: hypothetical protein COA79_21645 [Planctomycetota bacterium]|nr:MAG: hypothetical protein COA79_21645 [Planctomycetota bacterium]
MTDKENCIKCEKPVPKYLYDINAGYCMLCYNEEIRMDSLKTARLNEEKAMKIAEEYLEHKYIPERPYYNFRYTKEEQVIGLWFVSIDFGGTTPEETTIDTNPIGFTLVIDDATGEIIEDTR